MASKALCIGINHYGRPTIPALNGCVNDARAWADLLVQQFGFPSGEVMFLTDSSATKKVVLSSVKRLLTGANEGDVLAFINASHGSYEPDGGEEDGADEVLCTYDYGDEVLKDDDLRELIATLPAGVRLTVISDSCHSGTITRVLPDDLLGAAPTLAQVTDHRSRAIAPSAVGRASLRDPIRALERSAERSKETYPEAEMKEILLSGCASSETSAEDWFGDAYHGSMTHFALQAIKEGGPRLTYRQLHDRITAGLAASSYGQKPQLEGSEVNKDRQIFT